jgi:LacI family transcriptional regulator
VLSDNLAGGALAANHLASAGYRRIVCIAGPENPTSSKRLEGFAAAAGGSGRLTVERVLRGNSRVDDGYAAMRRILGSDAAFDAVFVTNNLMTVGAMKALDDLAPGLRDKVGIVGFDLGELALVLTNLIASVNQAAHEMGRLVGERILLQQEDRSVGGQLFELTPTLALGHGVGIPAKRRSR